MEVGCDFGNDEWSIGVRGSTRGNLETPPPQATLTTPIKKDCESCINPNRDFNGDMLHHCRGTYVYVW